jgi:hypothetical protein
LVLEMVAAGHVDAIGYTRVPERNARNGHIAVGQDGDSVHRHARADHRHGEPHAVVVGAALYDPTGQGKK